LGWEKASVEAAEEVGAAIASVWGAKGRALCCCGW
jgi:hypothetical protein